MGAIAIVVAGGPLTTNGSDDPPRFDGRPFDEVIAVDGGLDVALAAGLHPTRVIGDLDSVSSAGLEWAGAHHVPVERHPTDKDDTDTALALAWVAESAVLAATDVVVLGASAADRLDHLVGNIVALGAPALATARSVGAQLGGTVIHVLHPGTARSLVVGAGTTFSLLALHGPCAGVCVSGARWPLQDADLVPASTLGISNESVAGQIAVSVGAGVLTVVVPGSAA